MTFRYTQSQKPQTECGITVELVTVAVTFAHDALAVGIGHLAAWLENCVISTKTHRATLVGDIALIIHDVNHRMLS